MEIKSLTSGSLSALTEAEKLLSKRPRTHVEEAALRWYLYECLQNLLDATAATIAELGLRKPPSYAETSHVLHQSGAVSRDFADALATLARSRNTLAYAYRRLESEELEEVLTLASARCY